MPLCLMCFGSARFVCMDTLCIYTTLLAEAGFFRPTQRPQGKERNEMASLMDRPIIVTSDDGVYMPLARCQAVADTREIIEIKFDLHHKLHN